MRPRPTVFLVVSLSALVLGRWPYRLTLAVGVPLILAWREPAALGYDSVLALLLLALAIWVPWRIGDQIRWRRLGLEAIGVVRSRGPVANAIDLVLLPCLWYLLATALVPGVHAHGNWWGLVLGGANAAYFLLLAVLVTFGSAPHYRICAARAGDRELLATAGWGGVRIWDPAALGGSRATSHRRPMLAVCEVRHGDRVLLAAAGYDREVHLWDLASGESVGVLRTPGRSIHALCQVEVGERTLLAAGDHRGSVAVWDLADGGPVALLGGHRGAVFAVCEVRAGERVLVASAGRDAVIALHDPVTGEQVRSLSGHAGVVRALCPVRTPRGELLASAGMDRSIRLWDPVTGEQLRVLASSQPVHSLCEVPTADGVLLASGGDDWGVHLWDPDTGRLLRTLGQLRPDLGDPGCGPVRTICVVHTDGAARVATAGWRRTGPDVQLWDPDEHRDG